MIHTWTLSAEWVETQLGWGCWLGKERLLRKLEMMRPSLACGHNQGEAEKEELLSYRVRVAECSAHWRLRKDPALQTKRTATPVTPEASLEARDKDLGQEKRPAVHHGGRVLRSITHPPPSSHRSSDISPVWPACGHGKCCRFGGLVSSSCKHTRAKSCCPLGLLRDYLRKLGSQGSETRPPGVCPEKC